MNLSSDAVCALQSSGVTFSITAKDLTALGRDYRAWTKRKRSFVASTAVSLAAIALFICMARLSELFPEVVTKPFFGGLILGAVCMIAFGMWAYWRAVRQSAGDDRVTGERIVGVRDNVLWLYKSGSLSMFCAAHAFTRISADTDRIFAYITTNKAHVFIRSVLERSEEGKAVEAWLTTAKAELDVGKR